MITIFLCSTSFTLSCCSWQRSDMNSNGKNEFLLGTFSRFSSSIVQSRVGRTKPRKASGRAFQEKTLVDCNDSNLITICCEFRIEVGVHEGRHGEALHASLRILPHQLPPERGRILKSRQSYFIANVLLINNNVTKLSSSRISH